MEENRAETNKNKEARDERGGNKETMMSNYIWQSALLKIETAANWEEFKRTAIWEKNNGGKRRSHNKTQTATKEEGRRIQMASKDERVAKV